MVSGVWSARWERFVSMHALQRVELSLREAINGVGFFPLGGGDGWAGRAE